MNNKRGWLKIVEAVIAILIVFGAVLFVMSKQVYVEDRAEKVYEKQDKILDIISKNETTRQMVLDGNTDGLKLEIDRMMPLSWNYSISICDITIICAPEGMPRDKDVYVKEVLITSTLSEYDPQKLRLFVWMK